MTAYVHFADAAPKNQLLSAPLHIPPGFLPVSDSTVTTTATAVPSSPSSSPVPSSSSSTSSAAVVPSPKAPSLLRPGGSIFSLTTTAPLDDVANAFRFAGEKGTSGGLKWKSHFVFERDGTYYADIAFEGKANADVLTLSVSGSEISASKFVGAPPYYALRIAGTSPLTTKLVFEHFKKIRARFGYMSAHQGAIIVPVQRQLWQDYLNLKVVDINGDRVSITDGSTISTSQGATAVPEVRQQAPQQQKRSEQQQQQKQQRQPRQQQIQQKRSQPQPLASSSGRPEAKVELSLPQAQFLRKKCKEELDEIRTSNSVKVHVVTPPKQPPSSGGPAKPLNHALIIGDSSEAVEAAAGQVKALLTQFKFPPQPLRKAFGDPLITAVAHAKTKAVLEEFDSFADLLYHLTPFNEAFPHAPVTVRMCGGEASLQEAQQGVQSLWDDLALEDVPVPAKFDKQHIPSLEEKFSVKIRLNAEGPATSMKAAGRRDALQEFKEHMKAKFAGAKGDGRIAFKDEEFLLLRKTGILDEWKRKLEASFEFQLVVKEKPPAILVRGKDAPQVREDLKKLKARIVKHPTTTVSIPSTHPVYLLRDHLLTEFEDQAVVRYAIVHKPSKLAKALLEGNDGDDGGDDDGDDGDDEFSDSSSVASSDAAPLTSSSSSSTTQKTVDVQIDVWYFQQPKCGIDKLFSFKAVSEKIAFQPRDVAAVRRLRLDLVQKKHTVQVNPIKQANAFVVRAFSPEALQSASDFIKNFLANSIQVFSFAIDKDAHLFIQQRREMFLAQLKAQYNLKRAELAYEDAGARAAALPVPRSQPQTQQHYYPRGPPRTYSVRLEGPQEQVQAAVEELKALLPLRVERIKVEDVSQALREGFEQELRQNYDVVAFFKTKTRDGPSDQPRSGYTQLTVIGDRNMEQWPLILQKVKSLQGVQREYKPSNYKLLCDAFFRDPKTKQEFKEKFNLLKFPFFDQATSVVRLVALEADLEAATTALELMIKDRQHDTQLVPIQKEMFPLFFNKGPHQDRLREVARKHGLPLRWQGYAAAIQGQKEVVVQAKADLQATLAAIISTFVTKTVQLPKIYAAEFEKENWKLCQDCFESTIAHLRFPDYGRAVSIVFNGVQIEVTCGNMVSEPSECIVNPANEQLQNVGGLAQVIEKKAGAPFSAECQRLIKNQGPVPVGNAVITSAGNISPPIKKVIHVVGPRWQGGNAGEPALLAQALRNVLVTADKNSIQSVSIPAISAGIFGYPSENCAQILASELFRFLASTRLSSLQSIRFCDTDKNIVALIEKHVREAHKQQQTESLGTAAAVAVSAPQKPEVSYEWKWRENDGRFIAFDDDQSYQIEIAYVKQARRGKMTTQVVGDLNRVKNGFTYEIDFDAMTEINTHYRANPRPIIRVPLRKTTTFQWNHCVAGQAVAPWLPFSPADNEALEKAYFSPNPLLQPIVLSLSGSQLQVEFSRMTVVTTGRLLDRGDADYEARLLLWQAHLAGLPVNTQSNVAAPAPDPSGGASAAISTSAPQALAPGQVDDRAGGGTSSGDNCVRCDVVGLQQHVTQAEQWIADKLKELTHTETVSFDSPIYGAIQQSLSDVKSKYQVTITKTAEQVITITGLTALVFRAKSEVLEAERSMHAAAKNPPHWSKQQDDVELKDLPRGDKWTEIEERLKQTLPSAQIHKIQRVQNIPIWRRYSCLKELLERRLGDAKELLLFHGTRANDPSVVYNSDIGFDLRYCQNGMWGIASYFAQNSSYSHAYSYTEPGTNLRQMFVAKVAVGKNAHIRSDSSLRKPPSGYDAVSGETNGSVVYMIYDMGRAYPEYLITYSA